MVDDASRLLGLDGLLSWVQDGPVVQLETRRRAGAGLSRVRHQSTPVQGTANHPPAGPTGRRPTTAVGVEQVPLPWRCDQPECPRKSFTESVSAVPPRKRLTTRLRASAGAVVADAGRTIVQSARDHDLSWPVAAAAFTAHAQRVLPAQPDPVAVLGIDEVPHWWQAVCSLVPSLVLERTSERTTP